MEFISLIILLFETEKTSFLPIKKVVIKQKALFRPMINLGNHKKHPVFMVSKIDQRILQHRAISTKTKLQENTEIQLG